MTNTESAAVKKKVTRTPNKRAIHISLSAYEEFRKLVDQANTKDYGRRVNSDDILLELLNAVSAKNIVSKVREKTLTQKDKIKKLYEEHCKDNGHIAYDDFLLNAISNGNNTKIKQ